MRYDDYRTHLKICEFLGKEPTGHFKKLHDYLTGLWEGMECTVVNSENDAIVLWKGSLWYMVYVQKGNKLWCQSDRVWSFFRKGMCMDYTDAQTFTKNMVEEHLGCVVRTSHYIADELFIAKWGTLGQQ